MKKALQGDTGRSVIFRNYEENSREHLDISWRRILSYLKINSLTIIRFCYLLVGIGGLAGVYKIITKVILLSSISYLDMVLIFGIACVSLAAIRIGLYSFYKAFEPPNI